MASCKALWFPLVPPFKGLVQLCSCHFHCLQWFGVVYICCVLHPSTLQVQILKFLCVFASLCVLTLPQCDGHQRVAGPAGYMPGV